MIQYYEMMGTRALWHEGWHVVAQRRRSRAAPPPTSSTTPGSSTTPRRTAPRCTTSPPSTPRRSRSWSTSGTSRPASTTCCRSTTGPIEDLDPARCRSPTIPEGGVYRYYPTPRRCPSSPRRRSAAGRSRSWPRSSSTDADAEGVLHRQRRPVRRALAVHQGPQALVRQQLPRHPARAAAVSPDDLTSGQHVLGMEFAKESHGEHGEAIGRRRSTSTTSRSPKSELEDPAGPLRAVRRGPDRRPGQLRPGLEGVRRAVRVHRRPHPRRRDQRRRRRLPRPRARLPRRAGTRLTSADASSTCSAGLLVGGDRLRPPAR